MICDVSFPPCALSFDITKIAYPFFESTCTCETHTDRQPILRTTKTIAFVFYGRYSVGKNCKSYKVSVNKIVVAFYVCSFTVNRAMIRSRLTLASWMARRDCSRLEPSLRLVEADDDFSKLLIESKSAVPAA